MSLTSITATGQTDDQNYVKTYTFIEEQSYDAPDFNPEDKSQWKAVEEVQYYDGLGRPSLNVKGGLNTAGTHVCAMQTYDITGRPQQKWLPVPGGQTPDFITEEAYRQAAASYYNDGSAFSAMAYDALGRTVSESTPGDAWHEAGRMKRMRYMTNGENSVKMYRAPMDKVSLVKDGYYEPGTLDGEEYEDEDGHTLAVYKDFCGRKVLERRDGNNDTYYVYNGIGQLRYVLSPGYQEAGYKDKYAYEYRYDGKGRVVKKILPGCEYTQYWYDNADRMAFMQDATLREEGLYRFFLYDRFGRPAIQGTCSGFVNDGTVNTCFYSPSGMGFMGSGYRVAKESKIKDAETETVSYYDDYDYLRLFSGKFPGIIDSMRIADHEIAPTLHTGLFQTASDGSPLLRAMYYDLRKRLTDVRDISLKSRLTATHTEYTFTDKVRKEDVREYTVENGEAVPALRSLTEHTYDGKTGLLLHTDLTLSPKGGETVRRRISSMEYDALGRISRDTRDGYAGAVAYGYDMHGWPVSISGPGFSCEIHYADGAGTPCYNGSISSMLWMAPDYHDKRGYKFTYDGLNRLTAAEYGERDGIYNNPNKYTEKVLQYTANGMIKRFQRHGRKDDGVYGKTDNITVALDGNRIRKVTDDAMPAYKYDTFEFADRADEPVEYTYNGVGALTSDRNKDIDTIAYDRLNHISWVKFGRVYDTADYVYAPDGTKLRTTHTVTERPVTDPSEGIPGVDFPLRPPLYMARYDTEYNGATVYKDGKLAMRLFAGGYASFGEDTGTEFCFYTKDHLGNNRAVADGSGAVRQITHYYPFGGVYGDTGLNPSLQPYKYNGKELDRTHGMDWYDYGAKMYDSKVIAWTAMDPLAEKYYHISPYVYCMDNPMNAVDIEGKEVFLYVTSLPGFKFLGQEETPPTHTFLVVKTNSGKTHYYAYGSDKDGFLGIFGGKLGRQYYKQDIDIINGENTDGLKQRIKINPPEGMTVNDFDQSVINTAESFGDNPEITYNLYPSSSTEGNCNSSTSTILHKAGVSKKDIEKIGKDIKGIKWGWGDIKPWTAEEQREQVNGEKRLLDDTMRNMYNGFK